MYDICDSVDSVEEASKLTTSIDSVLATGGFKVKGWTSNAMKDKECEEITIGAKEESEKVLGVSYKGNIDTTTDDVKQKSPSDCLSLAICAQLPQS